MSNIKFGVLILGWCLVPFILLWAVLMTTMATDLRDKSIMLENELEAKSYSSNYWHSKYDKLELNYQAFKESVIGNGARDN